MARRCGDVASISASCPRPFGSWCRSGCSILRACWASPCGEFLNPPTSRLARRLYGQFLDAELLNRAAEVSYYAILAVVPFLILLVSFIQIFLATTHVGGVRVQEHEAATKAIQRTLDQTVKPLLPLPAYEQ